MSGIQSRLLLLTALLLGTFLALVGVMLERAFRASVLTGAEEQLRVLTYSLMGVGETPGQVFGIPEPLPEPRLAQPASGLYAWVTDTTGDILWQSPSSQALPPGHLLPPPDVHGNGREQQVSAASGTASGQGIEDDEVALVAGQFDFHTDPVATTPGSEAALLHLRYAVIWESLRDTVLIFHVAADRAPFEQTIRDFRRSLSFGLIAATLIFVLAQFLAVRWSLRPLRRLAEQIRELEDGHRYRLDEGFPPELRGLVANLDRFAAHEEKRGRRYRKALDDLAHSLKTPLAVLRNALPELPAALRDLATEQIDRMQDAVTSQLSRASVGELAVVARSESLEPVIRRLLRALQVAYRERDINVDVEISGQVAVRIDERDLMELLGNVLDNAFKYAHSTVRVRAVRDGRVILSIDDDGPGLSAPLRASVLGRGARADETRPGQGIGLAVVADLVALYRGRLKLESSELGGLSVRIELP